MTNLWTASQIVAHWLKANNIDAPPIATLRLTNVILESIEIAREKAYKKGQHDAREENNECKQF